MYISSWNNIDIILKLLNISGKTRFLGRTVLMSGKWETLNYYGYNFLNIRALSVANQFALF